MESAQKIVSNIIPTTQVTTTAGTIDWMEALYESGAISFGQDGRVSVNPEVRKAITAMHVILAGGTVSIEITNNGGDRCALLERKFDRSIAEVCSAHLYRSEDDTVELPLSP